MRIFRTVSILLFLESCATTGQSITLGAGIGGVIGTGFGAMAGKPYGRTKQGAVVGGTLGTAFGGLLGWLEYKNRGNGKSQSPSVSTSNGSFPSLTTPEVRKIWVPDTIEDNKFIEGHAVYILQQPTSWRMGDHKEEVNHNGK